MVEGDGLSPPQEAGEVHVEMAHVADDDRIGLDAAAGSGQQAGPGRAEPVGEDRQEPGSLEDAHAPGGLQPQRHVAFVHLVAEGGEPLLQDPDARHGLRVVGSEEQDSHRDQ